MARLANVFQRKQLHEYTQRLYEASFPMQIESEVAWNKSDAQ
ncbi:MAG: hypothetical protein ABIP71_00885 [Verrucomicrobiota bacterium]